MNMWIEFKKKEKKKRKQHKSTSHIWKQMGKKVGHVSHKEWAHGEKAFKVINKKQGSFADEQTFGCYIMKEICLLSGIGRLTFDPDTAGVCGCSLHQRV